MPAYGVGSVVVLLTLSGRLLAGFALTPGEILVTNYVSSVRENPVPDGRIVGVDPITGHQTLIASETTYTIRLTSQSVRPATCTSPTRSAA